MKSFLIFLCSVVIYTLYSEKGFSEDVKISGDNSDWNVHSYKVNSQQFLETNSFSTPRTTVAFALESARIGDQIQFQSCFYDMDTNSSPDLANSLFNEWHLCSRQYFYLITDEALLIKNGQGQSNVVAAVSLAPFGLSSQKQEYSDMPQLKAQVVFLDKLNNDWKISLKTHDNKILNYLIKQADPLVYRANPDVLTSPEEVVKLQKKVELSAETVIINNMQISNVPVAVINGTKEDFKLLNAGVVITNWETWKQYYNAQEIKPPMVFDVRDETPVDYSTPVSAFRSFIHAFYVGDSKTLLSHVDETGRAWLMGAIGNVNVKKSTYEMFPKFTKYTVLLTAATTFQGNDYSLVFYRVQEGTNPKEGRVTFQSQFFKHTSNGYVNTRDIDSRSSFGNPIAAAKANGTFLSFYPKFYSVVSHSQFPTYYYTIDE